VVGIKIMSLRRLTVFSGVVLMAACAVSPSLLGVLGTGGGGVAGGVAANALGDWLDNRRKKGDLSNHDLTKAVGGAIALSILGFAQNHPERDALQKLARELPEMWPSFADPIVPGQALLQGIHEDQLTAWLTNPAAQRDVLNVSEWERAISNYFCPSVEIELNPATVTDLAAHLQNTFAFALREVLKADFETGGKAFAGMTLSLLGEILRTVQGLRLAGDGVVSQDLIDQLQARYDAIATNQAAALNAIADQIGRDLDTLKAGQTLIVSTIEASTRTILDAIAKQPPPRPVLTPKKSRPSFRHFQGREEEQARLNAWLTDENTKLSGLIAMAGMGKSTLAAKVFAERDDFVGKEWWDLGFAPGFETVARSLLSDWGEMPRDVLERMRSEDLCDALIATLQNERFLLVLDNLESVLDQPEYITFLQRWANGGQGSEVLITSQQPPNIRQNQRPSWCKLRGLEPEQGAALLQSLGIAEREPGKLTEFSELVDGHPLTLSLTAGLLNSQGSDDRQKLIEDLETPEFGDLLSRLEGQHRDQRVQLTTVLAANFGRLSVREREILTRLAVLRMPFGEDGVTAAESGVFWGLVNRGLLVDQAGDGVTILPFVRSYLLAQVEDVAPLHRWAIAYYNARKKPYPWDVFEERDRELAEVQDYLELFHHHFELGDYEQAFDVIYHNDGGEGTVNQFLDFRGFQQERIALYERLVAVWRDRTHWRYTASLNSLGSAYRSTSQYHQAIKYYDQGLSIYSESEKSQGKAALLGGLGNANQSLGDYKKALHCHEKQLEIAQEINDKWGEGSSFGGLGNAYYSLGNLKKAINYYEKQLMIAQKTNNKWSEANSLGSLGNTHQSLGDYQKALSYYEKSLVIAQEIKDESSKTSSLGNLSKIHRILGNHAKAIDYNRQQLVIAQQTNNKQAEGSALGDLGIIYCSFGNPKKAIEYHEKHLSIARKIKDKEGEASSLGNLGFAYRSLGNYDQAIDYHKRSLTIKRQIEDKQGEAISLFNLGLALRDTHQIEAARESITQARTLFAEMEQQHHVEKCDNILRDLP
jgi:tetratricopeptide (TPR) repeat protein